MEPGWATVASVTGTNPGPRSQLRYTLRVQLREGVMTIANVPPAGPGPADDWDVDAHPPGTEIPVTVLRSPHGKFIVKAWTREERAAGAC